MARTTSIRATVAATLAAIAVLLVGAAAAQACSAGARVQPPKRAAGAPLVVGDSVLLGAADEVARTGVEVDAQGCRTMAQGLDLLRARKDTKRLPRVVGLALGTNGTVSRQELAAAMRIAGPRRVLVLVTPRELGGGSGPDAQRMRRAARRHPGRVQLLDWVRRSAGRGSWFATDGIHLSTAGARGMARLLDAMPGLAPAPARASAAGAGMRVSAPPLRATGVAIPVAVDGAPPRSRVRLQTRRDGRWRTATEARTDADGHAELRVRPEADRHRHRLRAIAPGTYPSRVALVRTRDVTLAAFGDANLGDGVRWVMRQRGATWPWSGVAPTLRGADIASGNLECAVSMRGHAIPKEFNFRGSPTALRRIVRFAGLDVLNLANNHTGDFGTAALRDTVRHVRATGALPVGAGATLAAARSAAVVERLGLRVAFVGFSDVNPWGFVAGASSPGTSNATPEGIRSPIAAARRRADVVVATFHWGVERATRENARQRAFARMALDAGADAVVGAHPHVLQPVRAHGRRVVAYSLGNFVWAAGSPVTARTGILRLRLSARGVESHRLQRATIVGTRPQLDAPR